MRLLDHLGVLAVDLVRAAIARRPHQVFVPVPLTATRRDLRAGLVQPDRTTCGSACLVVCPDRTKRSIADALFVHGNQNATPSRSFG